MCPEEKEEEEEEEEEEAYLVCPWLQLQPVDCVSHQPVTGTQIVTEGMAQVVGAPN